MEGTETALTDDQFQLLKITVADWFVENRCPIKMIKVLYKEFVPDKGILENTSSMIDLLNLLCKHKGLNKDNPNLIYDTITITQQDGVWEKIHKITDLKMVCPRPCREERALAFSEYRQSVMRLGYKMKSSDTLRLRQAFNETMSTEYKDSWSLIMDLERKNILSEKKMMEFIEILRTNGLTFLIKSGDSVNNLSIRAINRKSKVKQHACKALLMVVVLLILGVITIHVFANKYPDHKLREDETIRNMLTAQQKQAYQKKIRTPPMLDVESNYDLSQMFTELEMYTTTKKENFKDKTKHTFQELLSFIKSREPCKVLITGNGGIGKTTLLQYISYNWATNNDTTFDGKILFLVNVRDIEVEPQSFTDVITDVNEGGKTFIEEHGREIVLLIDGLDELRFGINSKVLTIGEMEYSTVILTSRPGFIEYLYNHYDVHVKLEGFTAKNKKQYINKYFNYVGNFELGKSLITELKLDSTDTSICSGDHKNICEIISSPMLLLTTCIIWKNEKIIPKDFKRLFNEIVRNILNQFINRPDERKENAIPHGNLPTKYKNAILILGQLSYIRLQKNLLHFTKDDVCKLVLNETLVDLALSLGFVYKDSSMVQDSFMEIYRYQYKLLSEALAGFYLSNKIETFNSEECKKIRTNDYLHMVRKYTISFLGSNADKSMKCLETE